MVLVDKSTQAAQHKYRALPVEDARRALRILSAANEVLVRSADEPELLAGECAVMVEQGGYAMAWVGFAEHSPQKVVRPVAQYGHDDGYVASANNTWAETERGQGPPGSAIRTGRTQVNRNVLTNPLMVPWRKAALARGYQSSIALPLKGDQGTFGALSIYAGEPDAFDEATVALLEELAAQLSFGIVARRTAAERTCIAEQNHQNEARLRRGLEETIEAVCAAMEMRDAYRVNHQKRVTALAHAIAEEMGLAEIAIHAVKIAAIVHDVGTIRVPSEILAKPGTLSEIERSLFQGHAQDGRDILKGITFPSPIADIVWQHHERLDGSGYPRGLRGEEILLEARIIAVADMVDELASARPYRPALGMELALQEIARGRGTSYDATVVDACIRLCRENGFVFPA